MGLIVEPVDLIGWAATLVLVITLWRQIWKQWQADGTEAVSGWLFVGQITASLLFILYSALLHSWVFVVTNSLVLLTAIAGQILAKLKQRRKAR